MSQIEELIELEDSDLVKKAQNGEKQAFRVLVERYQNRAFAIARPIVKSREDAEDVVQEAFVKAYFSLKKFKGDSSFYTWLYRIVYNMAIDVRRKLSRKERRETSSDAGEEAGNAATIPVAASSESPEASLGRRQSMMLIREALNKISDEHRTVIMLREFDGLSYDEIADVTGVSRGTVMSRLHYARKKLQNALRADSSAELGVVIDNQENYEERSTSS